MENSAVISKKIEMKKFHSPKTVIGRFVTKHTIRGAIAWGLVFGIYVASKAIGYVDIYPTAAARQKIAETFSNNVGIELILGRAPNAGTTAAYTAWNTAGIMIIIGAIWAALLATKYFRGEEENGRQEVLLSGQTTARRAAINTFSGLAVSLLAFFIIISVAFSFVGRYHGVDFNFSAALYFSLIVILGITLFMAIGALTSQLMPTRSRATSVALFILGLCYIFRAIADVTTATWLLYINPLGWLENAQPLFESKPIWLLPIIALISILVCLTVYFAGKRDFSESILADKDISKPKTRLLNSPLGAAFRLTRTTNISWLIAVLFTSLLYGLMTKSAAQAFSQSSSAQKVLSSLAHQAQFVSATTFLGVVFFLQMTLIMVYAASSVVAIRREESDNYLDNYLVTPISRIRWFSGRLLIIISVVLLAGLLSAVGSWLGLINQHLGVSFSTLLNASINALTPVIFVIGVGIFMFGIRPRLTSFAAYGVLAWAFLIEMLSSGIKINHWILDTSILNHILLAPAVNPNWPKDGFIIIISLVLGLIGLLIFNRRDLQTE